MRSTCRILAAAILLLATPPLALAEPFSRESIDRAIRVSPVPVQSAPVMRAGPLRSLKPLFIGAAVGCGLGAALGWRLSEHGINGGTVVRTCGAFGAIGAGVGLLIAMK